MKRALRRPVASALLALAALCLLTALSAGCGKKEEASAPGYYSGPMQPKGQPKPASPTQGGK